MLVKGAPRKGAMTVNTQMFREVSNLNGMRKVMMLAMFTLVIVLTNFSIAYARYGLWYTTASLQCKLPEDSSVVARARVYLLDKKQTPLLPFGYFELICSWDNSDKQTAITTTKPTDWTIVWLFVGVTPTCVNSTSGRGFPVTVSNLDVPAPNCSPYEAIVTVDVPTH